MPQHIRVDGAAVHEKEEAARALLAALDGLVRNGFTDEELARRWSWSVGAVRNARAAIAQAEAAGIKS